MFLDLAGYALPKKDANGKSSTDISKFRGIPCRAFEINHDSKSVLIITPDGQDLGMFDFDQIERMFECRSFSGLLVPPDLDEIQALIYVGRVFSYAQNQLRDMDFIRKMVIVQSLAKGSFCDILYFNFSSPV
jgi:hypothetical protein